MGGHGGLNILPQKRWNVYNFDNREKVKKDEEEAAKEEQIKREQSRKRDAEFRLQLLRQARGLATPPGPHGSPPSTVPPQSSASAPPEKEAASVSSPGSEPEPEKKSRFNHINLFEGIKIFDVPKPEKKRKGEDEKDDKRSAYKKMKMPKEAPPRAVLPEDEKYRMGYGIAGKGVKQPWYMSKPSANDSAEKDDSSDDDYRSREVKERAKSSGKKTLQELREERLKREKREKERERALLDKGRRVAPELPDRYFHRSVR